MGLYDIDSERTVVGSILLDPLTLDDILQIAKPEHFASQSYKGIFEEIYKLSNDRQPISIDSLLMTVKGDDSKRQSWMKWLTDAIENSPTSVVGIHAAKRVKDWSKRRVVANVLQEGINSVDDINIKFKDILANIEEGIFQVDRDNRVIESLYQVMEQTFEQTRRVSQNRNEVLGVSTTFPDLDKILCGLVPGDLIIIAARPAMGKTALALNMAVNISAKATPVLFFSLEMSKYGLGARVLSNATNIPLRELRVGSVRVKRLLDTIREDIHVMKDRPLYIDDTPALAILEMRRRARRQKRNSDIQAIFIDYLQRVDPGRRIDSEHREIQSVVKECKNMARELEVPVVLLCQLNRLVEAEKDKIPRLQHLKGSGDIEQEADVVLFIYRRSVYFEDANKKEAELILAKNRQGPIGKIGLYWDGQTTTFSNLARGILNQ